MDIEPKWGLRVRLKITQNLFGRSTQLAKNFGKSMKKGFNGRP